MMSESRIAKIVIEKLNNTLSDEYGIKYKERMWGGLYSCEVIITKDNVPVAWVDWLETYERKLPRYEWLLLIPNERVIGTLISWGEVEMLSRIVNEINDMLGVWCPHVVIKEGGKIVREGEGNE
jgi:hypothetical protein